MNSCVTRVQWTLKIVAVPTKRLIFFLQCPFHGRIVARDKLGRVVNPEDEKNLEKEKNLTVPDWQDPQLLRDIQVCVIYFEVCV